MDPISLLSVIGSLASIISFFEGALKKGKKITPELLPELRRISDESSSRLTAIKSAVEAVGKISNDIREVIERRITNRREELLKDIEDESLSPRQQRTDINAAKADICRMLDYLKEFNGGRLPSPEFEQMWAEMGCAA